MPPPSLIFSLYGVFMGYFLWVQKEIVVDLIRYKGDLSENPEILLYQDPLVMTGFAVCFTFLTIYITETSLLLVKDPSVLGYVDVDPWMAIIGATLLELAIWVIAIINEGVQLKKGLNIESYQDKNLIGKVVWVISKNKIGTFGFFPPALLVVFFFF